ncbi:MAG: helix-turn-helix domain-containing protein [Ktedonobacteraceae bacterium]|nr:helix-turn-helix domain-containing protein [Ktedonobacteraceae bacterium]
MDEQERERIRRSYYVEKKSIHRIAREEGRHRTTIEPRPLQRSPTDQPTATQEAQTGVWSLSRAC